MLIKPTVKIGIKEVQAKIDALNKPKDYSFRPILIHANGVDDSVEEREYFDEIIDFATLLI